MKGSEKQIKWALDIKQQTIEALALIIKNAENGCYDHETIGNRISVTVAKELESMVIKQLEQVDSAKKMIDLRYDLTYDSLKKLAAKETNRRRLEKEGL